MIAFVNALGQTTIRAFTALGHADDYLPKKEEAATPELAQAETTP